METFESYINMNAAIMVLKIQPTSLMAFTKQFFGSIAPVT
jgi:hypothetical protein